MLLSTIAAKNLRALRREEGLTQRGLSRLMSCCGLPVSASAIARIEAGYRPMTVDEVQGFAHALRVTPVKMLDPSLVI